MQVATRLLKACAAAGLCLAEIGAIVSCPLVGLDEGPSDLEKVPPTCLLALFLRLSCSQCTAFFGRVLAIATVSLCLQLISTTWIY